MHLFRAVLVCNYFEVVNPGYPAFLIQQNKKTVPGYWYSFF